MIRLNTPIKSEEILKLRIGDQVLLSGAIYTARDAAHLRIIEMLSKGEEAPFPLANSIIYYVGPTPAKPSQVIGSAGPTTSSRMDPYSLLLFEKQAKISIGKGERSKEFKEKLKLHQGLYFSAVGGTAALISKRIIKSELIAFPELGAEAIYLLEVKDFPIILAYDAYGGDLFERERQKYQGKLIN